MSEQPRDWDRELADIDRVISRQGSAPAGGPSPVPPTTRPAAPPAAVSGRGRDVALTWFWVALGLALAMALIIWPYQRGCGLELAFYFGAAAMTALVGVLGALASWSHRRGFAHLLSLLVIVWASAVALRETLPRVGYAKASRTWLCAAAPAAPAAGGRETPAPAQAAPQTAAPQTAPRSGAPPRQ
jgi:hypothetical protein